MASLNDFLKVALAAIALYIPVLLFLRYRALRYIPGPFFASFTNLWRAYAQSAGGFNTKLIQLHEKYGPLVRLGPNSVSVGDPAAVGIIYTNRGEFIKADSYSPLRVPSSWGKSVGSVIDMQNEEQATALKRGIGNVFSTKSVLDYENEVDETALELIQAIVKVPEFDLLKIVRFFQLDFLTKIAFSENLGHLEKRQDIWGMAGPSHARIAHWVRWQSLPTLEHLVYQHPIWARWTKQSSLWVEEALGRLRSRERDFDLIGKEKENPDEKKDLLQKYLDGSRKHAAISHDTLSLITTSTISAGFDSTTTTITTILYFLIKHPDVLSKLQQELHAASLSSPIPTWTEVNKLEYLHAVFREAMRCNPFVTIPLERIVPAGGATIAGKYIPEGTVVGCAAQVVHHNRELYGADADRFRPERWLAEPDKRVAMERAFLTFGSGKRICMGRHIAELEIKKLIPAIVLHFKMNIVSKDASLDQADGLTAFPKPIFVKFQQISK